MNAIEAMSTMLQREREQWRVFCGFSLMRLNDEALAFVEQIRRYQSVGKYNTRNDEEYRREQDRQQRTWEEAALCRLEMKRREELER